MKHLSKPAMIPFSIKEIRPQGWLLKQLEIQAGGLSGNLDLFWPDIKYSKWVGGDREGWERVPYWLDGFLPLAWLLDREDMKERGKRYIDYIISHQEADGWICPGHPEERGQYDMWALFLILKVLVQYQDLTGDDRIEGVVKRALLSLDRHIDSNLLFSWAQTRWFEGLISIWWLYERTEEEWLLNLASKLQSQGFEWPDFFQQWPYKEPEERGRWGQMSHVVNNAMALKSGALYSRLTGREEELHSAEKMVELLDQYHGMVTGVFTGDECLSGKSPVQGTELCAVAEYMYSLEHLISLTGKIHWADRLEKIAFNALPAAFSPDMWTHQYDQQVNQVECSKSEYPVFRTNNGEANLFGLEPNFGCCTANLSQAWPKFAFHTFMKAGDGIAAVLYAPSSVNTTVDGVKVRIAMETDYPFRDRIHFKIDVNQIVKFPFLLRIPAWCREPRIEMEDRIMAAEGGTYFKLEREWEDVTDITLTLPMQAELEARPENLHAITRGPLVYSLEIGERWVQVNQEVEGREYPHCDYEVYAATSWNYGLRIDRDNPEGWIRFEESELGEHPFSPSGAPVRAKVKGSKIDWPLVNGSAAPVPAMAWVSEKIEELAFLPYGCTNLRLTELPVL